MPIAPKRRITTRWARIVTIVAALCVAVANGKSGYFLFSFTGTGRVHVAFTCDCADVQQLRLLGAALRSVAQNSRDSHRLFVHVFTGRRERIMTRHVLRCALAGIQISGLRVVSISDDLVDLPIKIRYAGRAEQRLRNRFNYVRFYLDRLMPAVDKVLYLDTDVIALDDVSKLYDSHLMDRQRGTVLAAVRRHQPLSKWVNISDPALLESRMSTDLDTFNAGVLLIRLDRWKSQRVIDTVRLWMTLNTERLLYAHGSQPPLLLAIGDNYEKVNSSWNVDGAGFKEINKEKLSSAKIIHWTGANKGCNRDAWHHDVWHKFDRSGCFSTGDSLKNRR